MAHERKDIRDAAIAALLGETDAGSRVSASRMAPPQNAELPCLSVYTDDETVDPASKNTTPRELRRTVTLAIEGWVSVPAGDALDDAFDALALEIETAMDADADLDQTVYSCVLDRTEMGVKMDGNRPMGCVRLEYTATYLTDLRLEEAENDFDTAATDYSLGGEQDDEDDQAHDLVEDIHE